MLAAYVAFYARYNWWAGDFAWGDRYISSAIELTTLLSIPLLLRYREVLGRTVWYFGLAVTGASVVIQCASLAFWLPLEIYQMDAFGHHTWVVFLRFKNIAAFALGRRAAWGLNTPTMFEDSWDAVHITAWNFLPSLLRHVGAAPLWAVHVLYGVWFAVACCAGVCFGQALSRSFRCVISERIRIRPSGLGFRLRFVQEVDDGLVEAVAHVEAVARVRDVTDDDIDA